MIADPLRNWQVDTEDEVRTLSAGLQWQLAERWHLGASWSEIRTDVHWRAAFDDAPMPTIDSRLSQFSFSVGRKVSARLDLQAAYEYYAYRDDDWALRDVSVTTLDQFLLTGEQPDDEHVNVVVLTLRYRFVGE